MHSQDVYVYCEGKKTVLFHIYMTIYVHSFLALCEPEVTSTSHGTYSWPVTRAEENVTISCQYGQALDGPLQTVVAVRECDERGEWIESNFEQCASFSDSTLQNISIVCVEIITLF